MANNDSAYNTNNISSMIGERRTILSQEPALLSDDRTLFNIPDTNIAGIPVLRPNLNSIIPPAQAAACNAFAVSMLQVKNVQRMEVEKVAQVIPNLETIKDLAVNGTSIPSDNSLTSPALSSIANGSGTEGTYRMCDFFGAMSGVPYQLQETQEAISSLDTSTLESIYDSMITLLSGAGPYNSALNTLIANAEAEMQNIINGQIDKVNTLNSVYNSLGTQLLIEKNARIQAFPDPDNPFTAQCPSTTISFVDQVPIFALETQEGESAQILENIADTTTVTGQNLIALMRQERNQARLEIAGGELDNNISDQLPVPISNNLNIPKVTGAPSVPGSLAGSPYQGIVPPNLDVFNITPTITPSIYTPEEASGVVEECNCECWQN